MPARSTVRRSITWNKTTSPARAAAPEAPATEASATAEGATALECATVAWRACVHACAQGGLPPWLQREAEEALITAQRAMANDGAATTDAAAAAVPSRRGPLLHAGLWGAATHRWALAQPKLPLRPVPPLPAHHG